jgi:hypothetical protein
MYRTVATPATASGKSRSRYLARLFSCTTPILFKGLFVAAQAHPGQPTLGPGGSEYVHESVTFYDHAASADGYWLFLPADPLPDSAEVVVFLHGYGAYNPMCYGKWIKHLVAKGNIVIYPRYQKNLVWPRPEHFPENAAKGIRDALEHLRKNGPIQPKSPILAILMAVLRQPIWVYTGKKWAFPSQPLCYLLNLELAPSKEQF